MDGRVYTRVYRRNYPHRRRVYVQLFRAAHARAIHSRIKLVSSERDVAR